VAQLLKPLIFQLGSKIIKLSFFLHEVIKTNIPVAIAITSQGYICIGELLKLTVTGMENLELTLKSKFLMSENLSPKPLNFQNARLNRIVPVADLRRFDALLFSSTSLNYASEKTKEKNGNKFSFTDN
jgi:hypothetical protein